MLQNSVRQILLMLRVALLEHETRLPPCDYLLICHDNDRAYSYEGLSYSQLIDTIRENLLGYGFRVAVISAPLSFLTGKKAAGNPIPINGLYARNYIIARLRALFARNTRSYIASSQTTLWLDILTKMTPSYVIGIQPCAPLCAAGKDLKIPVFDLQHGIIDHSEDHTNYYCNRDSSVLGKKGIPSSIICWNDASANHIKSTWPATSTIVVGNPWLLRFAAADPQDKLVSNEINLLQQKLSRASGRKIILLTTQFASTFDRIDIPNSIKEAISLTTSERLQWCIKFHPIELKKYTRRVLISHAKKALGEENWLRMIDLSLYALPAILLCSSYHVTGFSAATFESSFLGVKTGFWDRRPETQTWFKEEIQGKTAELLPLEPTRIANKITNEAVIHDPYLKI